MGSDMTAFLTYIAPPEIVIINADYGGPVIQYESMVERYISEGRRIEINGMCSSACTLALTSPNACVTKTGQAAWHQAYDHDTRQPMPEVTERMIRYLPPKLRTYLDGKIQRNYTPETILGYDRLIALGVKPCDPKAEVPPTWTVKTDYSTVAAKVSISPEQPATTPQTDKTEEWNKYWTWASRASSSQFGKTYKVNRCFEDGICSTAVYYYDYKSQFVTAVEYHKGKKLTDRMVCRSASPESPSMTCVGWYDQKTVKYFQDPKSGEYFESSHASR